MQCIPLYVISIWPGVIIAENHRKVISVIVGTIPICVLADEILFLYEKRRTNPSDMIEEVMEKNCTVDDNNRRKA